MSKELREMIVRIVKEKKPASVEQLVALVKKEHSVLESRILECILQLEDEGKIAFVDSERRAGHGLFGYLMGRYARWFWACVTLSALAVLAILMIPESSFPLVYLRYVLGLFFVLFLPGYGFIRVLFPVAGFNQTSESNIHIEERIVLSIGFSLALSPVIGILLDYTPFAVQLGPIVVVLLTLTLIFATIGVVREYEAMQDRSVPVE